MVIRAISVSNCKSVVLTQRNHAIAWLDNVRQPIETDIRTAI
jgi:hypothetical protein